MKQEIFKFDGALIERNKIRQLALISGGFLGCSDTILRLKYMANGKVKHIDKHFADEEAGEARLEEIRKKLNFISISHREIYNPEQYVGIEHYADNEGNYRVTIFMTYEQRHEIFSSAEDALEYYSGLPDNTHEQRSPAMGRR